MCAPRRTAATTDPLECIETSFKIYRRWRKRERERKVQNDMLRNLLLV
jgi:hypothetical protein